MKNKFLNRTLLIGLFAFLGASFLAPSVFANSKTVSTYEELDAALCEGGDITIGADIAVNGWLARGCDWIISKDTTIDFNGHTVTSGADFGYNIDAQDSTLTFKDSVGGGGYTQEGSETSGINITNGKFIIDGGVINGSMWVVTLWHDAELVMNGGEINASNGFAITGNGTTDPGKANYGSNTKITINDGVLTSANDYVIYNPSENSTVDIHGGTFTGGSGALAANRGTINIYGGEFKSLGIAEASGDVAQDGTRGYQNAVIGIPKEYGPVTLNIYGGKFINENGAELIADVSGLDNQNVATVEISGGEFTAEPKAEDIEPGLEAEKNAEGLWELLPIEINHADNSLIDEGTAEGHVPTILTFNEEFIADRKATLSSTLASIDGLVIDADKGGELIKAVNIEMLNRDGQAINVEGNDLVVVVGITDEEYAKLSAFDKVVSIYFDESGVETERFDAEILGESGSYSVAFNTPHLSTYGIAGVNAPEDETPSDAGSSETDDSTPADSPNTGSATVSGMSASNVAIVTAIVAGIVTSIASFVYLTRKH